MTLLEKDWQSQVVGIAKQYGWTCFHPVKNQPTRRGHRQTTEPGWPDLVLLGHARALFVELKREDGKLRPEQVRTLERLREAGCETGVWRPSDLPAVIETLGPRQKHLGARWVVSDCRCDGTRFCGTCHGPGEQ